MQRSKIIFINAVFEEKYFITGDFKIEMEGKP